MKYSVLKRLKPQSHDAINDARESALKTLKAVLLIANVPGRNGTVEARIRRFNSSRDEPFLSKEYLKKGKQY